VVKLAGGAIPQPAQFIDVYKVARHLRRDYGIGSGRSYLAPTRGATVSTHQLSRLGLALSVPSGARNRFEPPLLGTYFAHCTQGPILVGLRQPGNWHPRGLSQLLTDTLDKAWIGKAPWV
jgi:hypothetical protein